MRTVGGRTDRVVVVGAGLSGLSAALQLAGRGRSVTVVERENFPGGRMGRLDVRGYRLDTGPTVLTMPDIIEDASRKQKLTQDKIAAEHAQVSELEKQLETHRKEIAALEADLKETTSVKERLQLAEKTAEHRGTSPLFVTGAPSPISTLMGRPLDKLDKPEPTSSKD